MLSTLRKVKKPRIANSLPTRRSARLEAKVPRHQLGGRWCPSTTKANSISAHMNGKVNDLEESKSKRKRSPGNISERMIKKRRSTTTKDLAPEDKSSSERKKSPGGVSGEAPKKRRSATLKDPAPESQEALQYSITNFTQSLRDQKSAKVQDGPSSGSILGSANTPPIAGGPYQTTSESRHLASTATSVTLIYIFTANTRPSSLITLPGARHFLLGGTAFLA
ncbi:hypothetical protein BJ684DRAFT_20201 [Piptocephalis cylindrospora]|uniref:Uncharacterized protein n=1 Tax=Piptocephalis cylindrospora TaxID=1907219 RepID=A0A4P9Y3B2_9FUNG|nr:hypothetical protein BJ684DRAFT_20201 [Piptocephalis cylindrospora]|eukprot:RKP13293.1 hypothetical protein BJ684DRAFT_20201 [Piptocephalis cylindrospora]